MGLIENPPTIFLPLLFRNLVFYVLFYADKSIFYFSERYTLLKVIRYLVVSCFLFFLKFIPSNLVSLQAVDYSFKPRKTDVYAVDSGSGIGDSGIARALSQVLSSVNDIPVSSRKYEIVRSLAEWLIEENNREGVMALGEVNRVVLSAAFSRTLCQLEAAMAELGHEKVGYDSGFGVGPVQHQMIRAFRAVRSVGDGVWSSRVGKGIEDVNRSGKSAEKLAAELLWLAQKLAACGFVDEAVERWASASNLASLSLMAEQRLQGSLIKVSAFLFKQGKNMTVEEDCEGNDKKEKPKQTKMKMMTSWLPLLCQASVPVLSINERAELEKVLEDAIEKLGGEEQEQVLSLWLHHFTYCASSDWPNLYASYARWCTTSRNLFFLA
ncbi:hypothetical protein like AT5G64230 [Hibiscus trionum]|nr:hypothetical protein like AT5G64230 [Hibiscus trionum]